jgi:hypothetical protein
MELTMDIYFFWYIMIITVLVMMNGLSNKIGNWYYHKKPDIQIFDVVHHYLPQLDRDYHYIIDFIVGSAAGVVIMSGHFNEYITELLTILSIRAVTNNVTIFPKDPNIPYSDDNSLVTVFKGYYDKVFSGHTSTLFLAYLFILENSILPIELVAAVFIPTIMSIIMMRSHFTVDIILAIVITFLVHHYFKKSCSCEEP